MYTTRCKQRAHLLPTPFFDIFLLINTTFFAPFHLFHSCRILPHSSTTTSDHRQDIINVLWPKKRKKSPENREKKVTKFLRHCFWASLTRKRGFRLAYIREDIAYYINGVSQCFWGQRFWMLSGPETGCFAKNAHDKFVVLNLHICITTYNFQA